MCTCLEFTNISHYFGRTLDLEYHYNEEAVITPRNYSFKSTTGLSFKNKYALIGTAMVINAYPFYYEAANECGLAMAGLNFPNNCHYNDPKKSKLNLAMFELIPYILGNYKSIMELKEDLANLNITNLCYNPKMPITPLHFMLSDNLESIVIESTKSGIHIYENKLGVMTNNPTFDLVLLEVEKYKNLSNTYLESENKAYSCVGLNALGLPGDYSSLSRLIKTNFLRNNRTIRDNEEESVSDFFHILDAVSMVSGSVLTKNNLPDITFYTSCINLTKGIYYYKTYTNNQINVLALNDSNMNKASLTRYPLITKQGYNYLEAKNEI